MSKLDVQDWKDLKDSAEKNLKQLEISTIQFETLKNIAENKLAEIGSDAEKELTEASNGP